jgi:hypothetical protein
MSGTKAQLIVSIFSKLELPGPTRLPVCVWRACALERSVRVSDYFLHCQYAPAVLKQLACVATDLARLIEEGKEPPSYCAPAGAPALTTKSTLAEARVALLARGVRTSEDVALLELVLKGVVDT